MSSDRQASPWHPATPTSSVLGLLYRRFTATEVAEIISRAAPYYIERLSSTPYYAALRDNPRFWQNLVGSRIVAAYELLACEEGFSLPNAVIARPDGELSNADRDRILAKPVWRALLNKDLAALDLALFQGGDPNEPHPYSGNPPLYLAINIFDAPQERWGAVSSLLRAGASAGGISGEKAQLLFLAYCAKDTAVMELLLTRGADPNCLLNGGQAIYDHAEIDYRYQQYYLEVPVAPGDTDLQSECHWLEFLERIANEVGSPPPLLLRWLWDRGARPLVPLLERVSGSFEEQEERAAARFQAAVDAAKRRSRSG